MLLFFFPVIFFAPIFFTKSWCFVQSNPPSIHHHSKKNLCSYKQGKKATDKDQAFFFQNIQISVFSCHFYLDLLNLKARVRLPKKYLMTASLFGLSGEKTCMKFLDFCRIFSEAAVGIHWEIKKRKKKNPHLTGKKTQKCPSFFPSISFFHDKLPISRFSRDRNQDNLSVVFSFLFFLPLPSSPF